MNRGSRRACTRRVHVHRGEAVLAPVGMVRLGHGEEQETGAAKWADAGSPTLPASCQIRGSASPGTPTLFWGFFRAE